MVQLSEGRLRLTFAAGWQALKFDETDWHRQRFGTQKAMDILAVHDDQHWWIEIKDCEGDEQNNLPRMSPTDLPALEQTRTWIRSQGLEGQVRVVRAKPFIIDEVIEKLRSTLVTVLAAQREGEGQLIPYAAAWNQGVQLKVVLLLTWDINDFRRLAHRLQQKLNSALRPYGLQGVVVNTPPAGLDCQVSRI